MNVNEKVCAQCRFYIYNSDCCRLAMSKKASYEYQFYEDLEIFRNLAIAAGTVFKVNEKPEAIAVKINDPRFEVPEDCKYKLEHVVSTEKL